MFFDYKGILQEDASAANEPNDIDQLLPQDPSTEEGLNNIANQIEDAMQQQALEHADYFENSEEAINEFFNSPEIKAIMEADTAAVMPAGNAAKRRTIVLLNKRDDLTRRARLGSLIIARERKDPLFDQLAKNRIKERALRKAIFQKYGKEVYKAARISQKKHMAERKKFHLPMFKSGGGGKEPSYNDIFRGYKPSAAN